MSDGFEDAINDISRALFDLRMAFRKHHLKAPDTLEWSKPDDAREVEILLRQTMVGNSNYVMDSKGRALRQSTLAGFTVQHEANPMEDFHPNAYIIKRGL